MQVNLLLPHDPNSSSRLKKHLRSAVHDVTEGFLQLSSFILMLHWSSAVTMETSQWNTFRSADENSIKVVGHQLIIFKWCENNVKCRVLKEYFLVSPWAAAWRVLPPEGAVPCVCVCSTMKTPPGGSLQHYTCSSSDGADQDRDIVQVPSESRVPSPVRQRVLVCVSAGVHQVNWRRGSDKEVRKVRERKRREERWRWKRRRSKTNVALWVLKFSDILEWNSCYIQFTETTNALYNLYLF